MASRSTRSTRRKSFFCAFDASDNEIARIALSQGVDGLWRGFAPGLGAGTRYGFRVDGPFDPAHGHRFDVSKVLADPYAALFDRPFPVDPRSSLSVRTARRMCPRRSSSPRLAGEAGRKRVSDDRLVIYELNLRGFSRENLHVPEAARGRFGALAVPAVLDHLSGLGVTAVEIMPADIFVDERHLPELGLHNAWGYNSVVYGAPDPRLAPGGWADVRAATDALHARGMEAILDVVFNHNGESDQFGPTLSFRGLDNASYFRLPANDLATYINDCGTGNCLRLDARPVIDMAVAALRRWAAWGGIDGFRFDLATACGRQESGFSARAPFFAALADDPVLRRVRLIAEPWDVGPGGYQLGNFPPAWAEWNDHFRDTARRFWRGDPQLRGELATRIAGSRDIFNKAPNAGKTVNFIVAHDGFTLADLVSYVSKHNEANGENNRDGSSDNHSWNHGVEGPTDDPAILAARAARRAQSAGAARGLARHADAGDGLRTWPFSQGGNNNAYAQDNAITTIHWANADAQLTAFTGRLFAARADHAALRSLNFFTGAPLPGSPFPDVEWRDGDGVLTPERWGAGAEDTLAIVLSAVDGDAIDRCLVIINRSFFTLRFALPEARAGMSWIGLVDTSDDEGRPSALKLADVLQAPPRSTLIFAEGKSSRAPPRASQIDALAGAAGLASVWHDISGKRTEVSAATKVAALGALGFPAGSEAEARDSLGRLIDETTGRPLPSCAVHRVGDPFRVSVRVPKGSATPSLDFVVETKGQTPLQGRAEASRSGEVALADERRVINAEVVLPELPVGRHRLTMAGSVCELIVAPRTAYFPQGLRNPRFGLTAQTYAQRRPSTKGRDQGIGDFTTLAALGEAAGARSGGGLAFSPVHALFPTDRSRCSPYSPSDRRFIDPIYIDALDDADVPNDEGVLAAIEAAGSALEAVQGAEEIDYELVWRTKLPLLLARFEAFKRSRYSQPETQAAASFSAFVAERGEVLRRFALYEALAQSPLGSDWRKWPTPLRLGDKAAAEDAARSVGGAVAFAEFTQWLADRQLQRAASRAKAAGLDLGLFRDLAVGAAPDGAEAWTRKEELAHGLTIGAPPDPFSAQGQNWNIPPVNPLAAARHGWRGVAELFRANMRHAGLLRVDHVMGLTRLFVLPEGGKPAEGTYLQLPFRDVLGVVSLESQLSQCALVGEDLGTVPEHFRPAMAERDILGMSVLWFERDGVAFADPKGYPKLSVTSVSTHDLATLAGWWIGADIGERLMLGLDAPDAARRALEAREAEKRALIDALIKAGRISAAPDYDAPITDALVAAVHAHVGSAGSALAIGQLDDLAGETIGTNLPGTDRERPNWRRRLGVDVEAALAGARGAAVIAALSAGRKPPA